MSGLIRYDAACRALAECIALDEVKAWHDKAAAMQAYGRMAQDKQLEADAAEIRIRAVRRLGEIIAEQKENGGLNSGGRPSKETPRDAREVKPTTLKDAGISHDLSSRAQKLAAVPDAEFEQEVGEWRERVSSENARVTTRLEAAGVREQKKSKPKHDFRSAEEKALAEDLPMQIEMLTDAVAALVEENEAMKNQVAALVFDGSAEERAEYLARLNELIADNKRLTLLNKALTDARDTAMAESNALRGQIRYMKKQAEKS
jgi:hypothetical protein